jgi:nucleoid-associated protein YgaU/GH25 family lysozyme M1 (1,4-beta-N-acetylmuramidase)
LQYNGVDVSEIQGSINWNNVEESGIKFAMVRATYGYAGVDGQFTSNMEGISKTNIYPGAYHQSSAQSIKEAVAEANHFLNVIRPYKFYYPLALKIESQIAMQIGTDFFTEIVSTFLNVIKEAGYWPMLYAEAGLIKDHSININRIPNVDIWLAELSTNPDAKPTYTKNVTIWKHSDRGSVQGISGNANLDISYVDYPTVIKRNGLNNLQANSSGATAAPGNKNIASSSEGNGTCSSCTPGSGNMSSAENAPGSAGISKGNEGVNNASNAMNQRAVGANTVSRPSSVNNFGIHYGTNNTMDTVFHANSTSLEPDFSEPSFYTVDKNDTLRSIAKKVLGDPEQYRRLMELNGLTRPIIFAGQTLRIPQDINSSTILYRVVQGDTLWRISEKYLGYGPRYEEIMNMNGLTTDMIYPGQILKIPADQNAFSQTYTVQEGDTLWKIATNFLGNGNRYTEIMSLNDLQNGDLIVGQSLRIPAK